MKPEPSNEVQPIGGSFQLGYGGPIPVPANWPAWLLSRITRHWHRMVPKGWVKYLHMFGKTSKPIPYNATAEQIQAALGDMGMPAVVVPGEKHTMEVTFTGRPTIEGVPVQYLDDHPFGRSSTFDDPPLHRDPPKWVTKADDFDPYGGLR